MATTVPAPTIGSFSVDSGVVGDRITNDNTLTLTGTAVAGSTVKVYEGSAQLGTATANSSGVWSYTTTVLADGTHSLTATATTTSTSGTSPLIFEDFNPWSGNVSPDGIWRIAGTWTGTGNNTLQPSNVSFTNTYPGETDTGFMYLTVPAGSPLRGAELQSLTTPGYSYGYYEARIETTNVKNGGVVSFFWIEQPNYGSHEWDIEFTLSDSWAGTSNPGRVSFTTHPLDNTQWVNLGFNPSQGFHEYGFLWTPGRIDFTVDDQIVRTVIDPVLQTNATGYIMMNTWSGVSNFGGGPPSQNATSVYDWVKFYPGATSIPVDGGPGGTSGASAPLSVTVDTKAPSAPTIAASTPTSTHVEVLTGTAEVKGTVGIFDGTTKIGSAIADTSGAWSYTTAALSTGSHSFTATATDVAGNTGAASSAAVVTVGAGTPNLVVNGGFESGNFSGWTLSGNSGGNQIYIAPTVFPGEVHSGSYSAGLGSVNRTDGILTQSIATTTGQHYTLSFWIESDNDGSTPINHFAAKWNGQTLMAATDAPNSGYQLHTFDVVGINGNSVLEFDGYNSPDAWRLDDVTLTAVGVAPPAVAGSVSINDVTISEGNSGTKVATFTVTRSGGTAAFDVNYATSNGTATVADGDYVTASNMLHFGGSQNTQTISVTINGDTKVEGNETFNVNLSSATNGATISDGQGIGTITNDDGAGTPNLVVNGDSGANVLNAGAGNDTVNGGSGNDTINGGTGNDTLTGGPGNDTFLFNTALSAANNVDRITDFNPVADTIQLENAVFTSLTHTGTLAPGAFYMGAAAHDSTDRIIYDPATGALMYDSNGNAAGGATQFATLAAGLSLTRADFVVV